MSQFKILRMTQLFSVCHFNLITHNILPVPHNPYLILKRNFPQLFWRYKSAIGCSLSHIRYQHHLSLQSGILHSTTDQVLATHQALPIRKIWVMVFKYGPNKICGRKPLKYLTIKADHITSNILKAVFHLTSTDNRVTKTLTELAYISGFFSRIVSVLFSIYMTMARLTKNLTWQQRKKH